MTLNKLVKLIKEHSDLQKVKSETLSYIEGILTQLERMSDDEDIERFAGEVDDIVCAFCRRRNAEQRSIDCVDCFLYFGENNSGWVCVKNVYGINHVHSAHGFKFRLGKMYYFIKNKEV